MAHNYKAVKTALGTQFTVWLSKLERPASVTVDQPKREDPHKPALILNKLKHEISFVALS